MSYERIKFKTLQQVNKKEQSIKQPIKTYDMRKRNMKYPVTEEEELAGEATSDIEDSQLNFQTKVSFLLLWSLFRE